MIWSEKKKKKQIPFEKIPPAILHFTPSLFWIQCVVDVPMNQFKQNCVKACQKFLRENNSTFFSKKNSLKFFEFYFLFVWVDSISFYYLNTSVFWAIKEFSMHLFFLMECIFQSYSNLITKYKQNDKITDNNAKFCWCFKYRTHGHRFYNITYKYTKSN